MLETVLVTRRICKTSDVKAGGPQNVNSYAGLKLKDKKSRNMETSLSHIYGQNACPPPHTQKKIDEI